MITPSVPIASHNWRDSPVAWCHSDGYVDYTVATRFMENRADAIRAGHAQEMVWLVEHPPLYTAGTSAKPDDLRQPDTLPVHHTKRGGQYTYHGPGQRVVYAMLDLTARSKDVRRFVQDMENWTIATLAHFNVTGQLQQGRIGVWVDRTQLGGTTRIDKIAAIGIRVKKWVTFHGLAINVEPDLTHFDGITPCGISELGFGVTSLTDLGRPVTMQDVDTALQVTFQEIFGPVHPVAQSALSLDEAATCGKHPTQS